MELYIGVLESFGADKYKHWYENMVESVYNIFILGWMGELEFKRKETYRHTFRFII